jgi:methylthioribose-1-phosphate isomerase
MEELRGEVATISETLARTRPTAVDLFWAIERMQRASMRWPPRAILKTLRSAKWSPRRLVHAEKWATDEAIGRFGAALLPAEGQVMTQCNAGALATGGNRHGAGRDSHGRRRAAARCTCWCPKRGRICRARG